MTNDYSSDDYNTLLNALNDFTLTVLSPIPNNSQLLAHWYKFKPLLAQESYDPLKINSFISSLDNETTQTSFKKPPLSSKIPSDIPLETPKENTQSLSGKIDQISNKNEVSYEANKKSGNSTYSSNSSLAPNLMLNSSQEQLLMKDIDLSVKNDLQYFHSKSDKPDSKSGIQSNDVPTYRRGMPLSVRESLSRENHTTRPQYSQNTINNSSVNDVSVDEKQDEENRKTVRKYEETSENSTNSYNQAQNTKSITGTENKMTQREGDDSHPEPPTPPRDKIITESSSQGKNKCLPALDFLAKTLNKPYSAVAEFALYTKLFVLHAKQGKNSFYYSLAIQYFLHLLSNQSTSLALSNLYEKVVVRRLKFSPYNNQEKLYESVTVSLKAIIREKIAKPGQTKILQELFLTKFYENVYFREGLVAIMKELLVNYISEMDFKGFHSVFRHTKLEKLIPTIRSSESEPTEEMISLFPYIVEGSIEIHYVRTGKIEIVLYNQKGVRSFKQTPYSILCLGSPQSSDENIYKMLINKDQVEIIEKLQVIKDEESEVGMKDTVYMSMDSCEGESEQEIKNEKGNAKKIEENIEKEKAQANVSKPSIAKVLNRDFLLTRVKEINTFMDRHTDKLSNIFKPKDINTIPKKPNTNNATINNTNPSNTPTQEPVTLRYAAPTSFTTALDKNKPSQIPQHYNVVVPPSLNTAKYPDATSHSPLLRTNPGVYNKTNKPVAPKEHYRGTYHNNQGINTAPSNALYSILNGNKVGNNNAKAHGGGHNVSYTVNNTSNTVNTTINLMSPPKSKNTNANTKQKEEDMDFEKENKEISVMNIRSPLKKIVVYSHQKDVAFANVEKEACLIDDVIRNSPKYLNRPDKLILEDTAI